MKLLLEHDRCVGVSVVAEDGVTRDVRATDEVIVCAGAIDSPRLLMLSGIGPAKHLKELGIEVAADIPAVGQHLQDHPPYGHEARQQIPAFVK